MTTLAQGLRGMNLLIDMNRDRLLFALAVGAALTLGAMVGAELLHPTIPIDPYLP